MAAYYNEFDPGAAAWLRELIKKGLIADGEVDERSILDVVAADLSGFRQCHFFAGIGGWSHALRLAGWPDDRPVWTGSPPCQPFSAAGKQLGRDDARHLAPHFISLVRAARPAVLFGEQVASAEVFGKAASKPGKGYANPPQWAWLDDLSDRLEAARYAVGAFDIPAAGIGAPHIRQRTFFGAVRLADTERRASERYGHKVGEEAGGMQSPSREQWVRANSGHGVNAVRLADTDLGGKRMVGEGDCVLGGRGSRVARVGHRSGCGDVRLADTERGGRDWRQGAEAGRVYDGADAGRVQGDDGPIGSHEIRHGSSTTDAPDSFWGNADWLFCRDGKWRPVEPGTFPLAHGLPARVGRLRGYGNAIVPQAAAEFIRAFISAADL